MVSLSDIPCVGIVVNRISEAIVDIAFRGSSYLFCTKNLVKDLNSQIKKVEILENEFARKVDEATNDGKIIEGHILEWQENVKNIKTQAAEISGQTTSSTCFRWLQFPNPVARFQRGRTAAHVLKTATEQTDLGKEFLGKDIAHHLPIENVPNSDTPYQSFGSRQGAYANLWDLITNEDGSPVLGIYGMPGVGKTRMMEQVWREVMEKGIFNKVTRANVGAEKINVTQLQEQLAGYLDCHFKSKDNEINRASQLKNSLMSEGKTLLILDDVWDDIPLNQIGIPFADGSCKGCKILLTSRRKDVCLRNNCQDPIEINPLTITEAWDMFKNTVGISKIESFQDSLLAEKVCKECGGLPLLIRAMGKALKFGTENIWNDALYQLQNRKFQEIDGIDPQVYACIQLSFLKLTESARRCLLLCALFPEDADIEINILYDIATASELLERGRNIGGLVDILKSSSLLLQGKNDYTVKLHDIVRDVARSIAIADSKYAFLFVRCKGRWPNNADYSTRRLLHIDLEGDNVRFPNDDLVCQHLCILWLQGNNHIQNWLSSFVKRFTNLRVVVLQSTRVTEEQFSISTLDNLRMLSIKGCTIDKIFLNSVSKTLETLCISECELPVPLDIAEFKDLIKLELVRPPPSVVTGISKLTRLEELNVPSGFAISEDDSTGISAELSTCNCLRKLTISFPDQSGLCPSNILDNLDEFRIYVGPGVGYFILRTSHRREIRLAYTNMERWMALLERAEDVELEKVNGLPIKGFSDSCNSMSREAFANLRELKMNWCYDMQHIARWDGRNQQQLKCFTNLRHFYIKCCNALEYVFSSRIANCLLQLQKLEIYDCDEIEEIVRVDDGQEVISFPNLTALYLRDLRKLSSLYNNKVNSSQVKILEVLSCKKLEIVTGCIMFHGFENLEQLRIQNCNGMHHFASLDGRYLTNLRTLKLCRCYGLKYLFSSCNVNCLLQLQTLEIEDCKEFEEIIKIDEGQEEIISFPKLNYLNLRNLNSLTSLCNKKVEFPQVKILNVEFCPKLEFVSGCIMFHGFENLEELRLVCNARQHFASSDGINQQLTNLRELTLDCCYGLKYLFSSRNANCLLQLQTLKIDNCKDFEEIIRVDQGQEENISFPKLNYLDLLNLNSLTSLCNNHKIDFSQLKKLEVQNCHKLEIVIGCTELNGFQNLEQVKVHNCNSLKTVFQHSSPANQNAVFPALRQLTLETLPHLESFLSYGNEFLEIDDSKSYTLLSSSVFRSFQQLQSLEVSGCNLLKEIVEDAHGFNQKYPISLPKLEEVKLYNLPNLQHSGISACYMPALSVLRVENCAISSLFTCSAFRNLHNLLILEVRNCHLLKEISVDDKNDETPGPSENMISLPLLIAIELEHLHGLKSFSSSTTFTFTMPVLEYITLNDCPCMDKFTFLQITTPLLEEDLNDYVRRELYGKCYVHNRKYIE